MNRRTFIISAGATVATAITARSYRLFAQNSPVLSEERRYSVNGISCIFQPDSVIFLRDGHPILAYRTTFQENVSQNHTVTQVMQRSLVPFPCFTRLSAPTSLLPLSPLRKSAAAAFVCDNVDGVNYTVKNSKKNVLPCGQIRSNGLKWKGMSEIGADDAFARPFAGRLGVQGVFDDECKWINPDGRVQMTDTRRFRVAFFDNRRYGIYSTIDWRAVDNVTITANHNCLFGVQASAPLAPVGRWSARAEGPGYASENAFSALPTSKQEPTLSGAKPRGQKDKVMPPKMLGSKIPTSKQEPTLSGGMMMNSIGDFGAQAIYGRRANWVTCWGRLQAVNPELVSNDNVNLLEGVALMSHPSNPWGVSPWNTTPYGYMSPTHIPFLSKPWTLRAGEGVRLRYFILAYTGDPDGGEVDEFYRSYSNS